MIVIPQHAQIGKFLESSEGRGFGGDPFFKITIGSNDPHSVVKGAGSGGGRGIKETAFKPGGHCHANCGGHSLAQRAGRCLHAPCVPELGVTWGCTSPGPKGAKVIHGQPVAGEEQLAIQGQTRMTRGKHKTVSPYPRCIARIMSHDFLEQHIGGWSQTHGRARVPVPYLLDCVHCQSTKVSNGGRIDFVPWGGGYTGFSHALTLAMRHDVFVKDWVVWEG